MSRLALVRDERFLQHITPETHPESPQRLVAIDNAIARHALDHDLQQLTPRLASEDEISLIHSPAYIEHLYDDAEKARKKDGLVQLDADTFMSAATYETAKLAAGAGLVGVDALVGKQFDRAFVAVRPPGHHALVDQAMGFCLFNNIAVAVRYAQKVGFKKVFVIDWDVHHGNGTQWAFYNDPTVFFTSFQQYPFWPYDSGWFLEDGKGDGKGANMNIPLPAGTGDRGYLHAFDQLVKPVCLEFNPDLIMVSAGYDAHIDDPLGQQRITTAGFAMLTQRVADLAAATGAGVVVFLEGGYNVRSLSDSVAASMRVLNAASDSELGAVHASYLMPYAASNPHHISDDRSVDQVDERVREVRKHFAKYWTELR
ncbi:MAG: histone deacetylase [Cyanobacteria bacterium SZAS TMP-1]|nr:histone deacetylase [Cyanobacteria bacterium SZAS TMP-1]